MSQKSDEKAGKILTKKYAGKVIEKIKVFTRDVDCSHFELKFTDGSYVQLHLEPELELRPVAYAEADEESDGVELW